MNFDSVNKSGTENYSMRWGVRHALVVLLLSILITILLGVKAKTDPHKDYIINILYPKSERPSKALLVDSISIVPNQSITKNLSKNITQIDSLIIGENQLENIVKYRINDVNIIGKYKTHLNGVFYIYIDTLLNQLIKVESENKDLVDNMVEDPWSKEYDFKYASENFTFSSEVPKISMLEAVNVSFDYCQVFPNKIEALLFDYTNVNDTSQTSFWLIYIKELIPQSSDDETNSYDVKICRCIINSDTGECITYGLITSRDD